MNWHEYGRSIVFDVLEDQMEYNKLYNEMVDNIQLSMTNTMLFGHDRLCVCKHHINEHIKDIPYTYEKKYPCNKCKCPGYTFDNLKWLEYQYEESI